MYIELLVSEFEEISLLDNKSEGKLYIAQFPRYFTMIISQLDLTIKSFQKIITKLKDLK